MRREHIDYYCFEDEPDYPCEVELEAYWTAPLTYCQEEYFEEDEPDDLPLDSSF